MKAKSKIKVNKGKLLLKLSMACALLFVASICIGFVKYPEQYISTWKYQLENDLANGNKEVLEYYNERYVANGKQLFGDKYIVDDEYLNMSTVIGYETSDDGVMLLTNDGNGYFIEK